MGIAIGAAIILVLFLIARRSSNTTVMTWLLVGIFFAFIYFFFALGVTGPWGILLPAIATLLLAFLAALGVAERKSSKAKTSSKKKPGITEDTERYRELIRFVSFCKKVKPLMGGSKHTIHVTYTRPERGYTGSVYATLLFYDFNEITFARQYAVGSLSAPVPMTEAYYRQINEKAGLTENDWPYGIDAQDFGDVLRGTYISDFFTVIPYDHSDDCDTFTFKVRGGIESRDGTQVSKAVVNVLRSQFPELQISQNFIKPYRMDISIQL